MALQKQIVAIPFSQGLETKADQYQIPLGKMDLLVNCLFDTTNEFTMRNGYSSLGTNAEILSQNATANTAAIISKSYGVTSFRSELLQFDGVYLYAYSDESQTWYTRGYYLPTTLSVASISRIGAAADMAISQNSNRCYVWLSNARVNYKILDTNDVELSGGIIPASIGPAFADPGFVRVEWLQTTVNTGYFVIIVGPSSAGNTQYGTFLDTKPDSLIANVGSLTTVFGAIEDTTVIANTLYVLNDNNAYWITPPNTANGPLSSPTTFVLAGGGSKCVFGDSSNNVLIAYVSGVNILVDAYTSQFASTIFTAQNLVSTGAATKGNVTATYNAGLNTYVVSWLETTIDSVGLVYGVYYASFSIGPFTIKQSRLAAIAGQVKVLAKTYNIGSQVFLPIAYASPIGVGQSFSPEGFDFVVYLPEYYDKPISGSPPIASPVAKFAYGTGIADSSIPSAASSRVVGQIVQIPFVVTNGISSVIVTHGYTPQSVEIGNNLNLSGGITSAYDGQTIAEQNFHYAPVIVDISQGTGGHIADGTYLYTLTYEWIDNQGQLHLSETALPVSFTVAGGGGTASVHIKSYGLAISAKSNNVFFVLWRSQKDATNGNYNRVPTSSPSVPGVLQSFTDTFVDTAIQGNQLLYTAGGVVDNISPPASIAIWTYSNRLLAIPADSRLQWWYSQAVIPGTPVQFSEVFVNNVDAKGGNLTSGAQMDDKNVLFKSGSIFYMTGQGPSPSGLNSDFVDAQLVVADAGCDAVNSIVLMPQGLMYQSAKGIYLLDRSLQNGYIGEGVQQYNGYTVVDADIMPNYREIRFMTNNGVVLVYDYNQQQWSTFGPISGVDAHLWKGNYVYVDSSGVVHTETPGQFVDGATPITMEMETGWLNLDQLQGFMRFYKALIVGHYLSPHNMTVQISYDLEGAPTQTDIISVPGSLTPYQWRVFTNRQKVQSIKIYIAVTATTPFGQAASISSLALEIGMKTGLKRMPAAQSYG